MNQKGGIALILLILIILAGLALGAYFITKNTAFSPQAVSDSNQSAQTSDGGAYQNPFDENASYENPFESYQNPFENL